MSAAGRALGLATTSAGLSEQGDWSFDPTEMDVETTLQAILSKVALGDRASARATLAALQAATGLSPDEVAMVCIVADPNGIFALAETPLWTEGDVVDDRSQAYAYRFLAPTPASAGTYAFPVSMNAENAVIRLTSVGALPFGVLSAEFEGYFTARAQRV